VSSRGEGQGPVWFTKEQEIIPTDFQAAELRVENAVIALTRHFYPRIVRAAGFRDRGKAPPMNGAIDGRLGRKMVVYESSVGAPAAAMIMETLVASGIKRVVLVGVAGSISSECRIGDVVVPTWGVREEGTSYHYVPGKVKVKASESLATAIGGHLGQGRFKEGGVWTVDAPYRETKGKIRKYSKLGVVAVDMESTALMAVAMCRKIEFAPVLVISDEAFGEKWVPEFHGPKVRRASEAVCRSVVELMSRS